MIKWRTLPRNQTPKNITSFRQLCSILRLNQAYSQKVTKFKQRVGKRFYFHFSFLQLVHLLACKCTNIIESVLVQKLLQKNVDVEIYSLRIRMSHFVSDYSTNLTYPDYSASITYTDCSASLTYPDYSASLTYKDYYTSLTYPGQSARLKTFNTFRDALKTLSNIGNGVFCEKKLATKNR